MSSLVVELNANTAREAGCVVCHRKIKQNEEFWLDSEEGQWEATCLQCSKTTHPEAWP